MSNGVTARKGGHRSLAAAAGSVSIATLISRILGVFREMVLAKYFPAFATDAFFAAFRIPNLLRDLFAEGALSAAFVPTFTDYNQNKGKEEAWRLANVLLNTLAILLSIITLAIHFGAKYLVYMLVSGYANIPGKIELTVKLTQILAPFLLTVALAAAVMGMLNTHGRFFIPAVAPAFFNLASILAGIFLAPFMPRFGQEPVTAMAIGSLVGGALQLFVQAPSLHRIGFHYQPVVDWHHPGLRKIIALMIPAAFGLAATQINILIDNQLASHLAGNGPVSWLNYAFRLMQLPIGLFGVAIATVNLTAVSRKAASNDIEGIRRNLGDAARLAAFLNIPATFGLIFLRYPIVQILYERGRFTHAYTLYTGDALLFYALGLYAYSLVKIVTPTFYALGDTKTPVKFAVIVILAKASLNVFLLFVLHMGFIALALGTSAASMLNTALLYSALRKRLGGLGKHGTLAAIGKITVAGLIMGLASSLCYGWISHLIFPGRFPQKALCLGFTIVVSLVILMVVSYLLKIEEAAEATRMFRSKFLKRQ